MKIYLMPLLVLKAFTIIQNLRIFFVSVKRCLKPNGRLILRDFTSDNKVMRFIVQKIEISLYNFLGYGDVKMVERESIYAMCEAVRLKVERFEIRKDFRRHCIIRKVDS